jgi:hypothetical protein
MPEPLVTDALREVHIGERVDEPESRPLDDVAEGLVVAATVATCSTREPE